MSAPCRKKKKKALESAAGWYAPCHVVLLTRVPDGARVGVEHGRDVHVSLLAGCSGGSGGGGHADSAEEEGSEGLREHHLVVKEA